MPEFPSLKVVRRVIDLIMRFYTTVIMTFELAPQEFAPTFYTREVDGKTYTIVDEWCSGFLQGMKSIEAPITRKGGTTGRAYLRIRRHCSTLHIGKIHR